MKITHLQKLAAAIGVALACSFNYAQAASIGDNFSIDPPPVGGGTIGNIDRINFSYQANINQQQTGGTFLDGDDHFDESGFLSYSAFQDDNAVAVFGTGLNNTYKMYSLFQADGTAGLQGNEIFATFSSFTFDMYLDANGDTTFNIPASGIGPTTVNSGDVDGLLGTATLLDTGEAHLFDGLANGDFQVNLTDFGLSVFGSTFFVDPVPFYKNTFITGVTTTVTGTSATTPFTANATGSGDQAFSATPRVPEPTTLTMLGLSLLGLGASLKRRKQQA